MDTVRDNLLGARETAHHLRRVAEFSDQEGSPEDVAASTAESKVTAMQLFLEHPEVESWGFAGDTDESWLHMVRRRDGSVVEERHTAEMAPYQQVVRRHRFAGRNAIVGSGAKQGDLAVLSTSVDGEPSITVE